MRRTVSAVLDQSIYLIHPDGDQVYEARSTEQAQAMAVDGWELATRAQVEGAQQAVVDADAARYLDRMVSDARVYVFADDKPEGFTLDAPAPPADEPPPPAPATEPTASTSPAPPRPPQPPATTDTGDAGED